MLRTFPSRLATKRSSLARAIGVLATGAAAALVISGCSGGGGGASQTSAKLQTIKIAAPVVAGDSIPFAYGNATGIWKKYGINLQVINSNTSVEYSEVGSGQADIAYGGPQSIQAAQKGAPLKIIGGIGPAYVQFLVQSGISSVSDLKGKTLGASAPGSSFDAGQELYLASKGMHSPADYKTVYFSGNFTAMITALIQKQIDGAWSGQPYIAKAESQNPQLHSIAQIDQTDFKVLLAQIITVNSDWAKSNKSALVQFIKAWIAASKESNANPDKTAQILSKAADVSLDQAKVWVKAQGPDDGYFQISPDNFKLIVQAYAVTDPGAASAKFGDLVDNSYATAAGVTAGD